MIYRNLLLFSFLLLPSLLFPQFTDDFSDGNFDLAPIWTGDTSLFQVNAGELQLFAPSVSDTAFLVSESHAIDQASWAFTIKLNFNPSSSNFAKIYLVSDKQTIKKFVNGYFVKVGGTKDDISLYRQHDKTETLLIDGVDGRINSNPVLAQIKVSRNHLGSWELLVKTGTGSYVSEGSIQDTTFVQSNWFGVLCKYTSTRSQKFFFDDFVITGSAYRDTLAPYVMEVKALSFKRLKIVFSEKLDSNTVKKVGNFEVNKGTGAPNLIEIDTSGQIAFLEFSKTFKNTELYNIEIRNIADTAGNIMPTNSFSFRFIKPENAQHSDIVFNEIHRKPADFSGIPNAEFVELYNRSDNVISLKKWSLTDPIKSASFPDRMLLPKSYLILCDIIDTSLFSPYGNIMGLVSFPSLNDSGDSLWLKDSIGSTIDHVAYSSKWYKSMNKESKGGWSLEKINPDNTCLLADNWGESISNEGGSPGVVNSLFNNSPNCPVPILTDVIAINDSTLLVNFNTPIDTSALRLSQFKVNNYQWVDKLCDANEGFTSFYLHLHHSLAKHFEHALTITGLTSCCGKKVTKTYKPFFIPEQGLESDIVINEVLFNPRPGSVDFVELYNRSNKHIDLFNWTLEAVDEETSTIDQKVITSSHWLFSPNSYIVVTKDSTNIITEYLVGKKNAFFQLKSLPTFNDEAGNVTLSRDTNTVIDHFDYDDQMHFALLHDHEGVSLERIHYNQPTNDRTNWHSASQRSGFATPGFQNSQFLENEVHNSFGVHPELFSPDNDGYNDVASIHYQFGQEGYIGNVMIYNKNGIPIREIANNFSFGTSGSLFWDGLRDDGQKAQIGIYIIYIEAIHLTGKVKTAKLSCVLAHQL